MEVGTKDECWYRLQLRLCLQVAWSPGEAEPGWTLELSTKIREDFTIMEKGGMAGWLVVGIVSYSRLSLMILISCLLPVGSCSFSIVS